MEKNIKKQEELENLILQNIKETFSTIDTAKHVNEVICALHSLAVRLFSVDSAAVASDVDQNYRTKILGNVLLSNDKMNEWWDAFYHGMGFQTMVGILIYVEGSGFTAMHITIENASGLMKKSQAVALNSKSDFSVFYQCSFRGHQDTLYAHSMRQFYRDCDIYGTIDFIFGDATAVFQNCHIYLLKPLPGQGNVITAQGRKDQHETTGFSIMNSYIFAAEDLGDAKSYLGRPWKHYSRTVFMKCSIDGSIDPAGWLELGSGSSKKTLYYGEYRNGGGGSVTTGRVNWPGYHKLTERDASRFTVNKFINGASWINEANVPYWIGI